MANLPKDTKGNNNSNNVLPVYFSEHALLKYVYKGCLGKHNKASYAAETYIFQCSFGIVHFHVPLN